MKRAVLYSPQALILVCLCGSVSSFHNHGAELGHASHRTVIKNKFKKNINQGLFAYYEDDDMKRLLPETSFGADAVPEGQRPVNEYLDLIRAPLFGWASEDVGNKGLLTRLVTVYVASFAAV